MFRLVCRCPNHILRASRADVCQFRVDTHNRALNRSRDINVEERPILTVHSSNLAGRRSESRPALRDR
jgi:hypothetical protein